MILCLYERTSSHKKEDTAYLYSLYLLYKMFPSLNLEINLEMVMLKGYVIENLS